MKVTVTCLSDVEVEVDDKFGDLALEDEVANSAELQSELLFEVEKHLLSLGYLPCAISRASDGTLMMEV